MRGWTCAVIRICYEDFSAGTHDVTGWYGKAVRGERGVTLYLLPGLTAGQRWAVIRRLRQEASRGFGPSLPAPQLAIALGLDRLRTAARTGRAIVRLHPLVTLVPGAFVVAAMALFIIASSDGSGGGPKTRVSLAEVASASGGSAAVATAAKLGAFIVRQDVARMNWGGRQARRLRAAPGAWYVRSPLAGPVSRGCAPRCCGPRYCVPGYQSGQPACWRAPSWAVLPHTAHRPGPRDLAR
jgi:hypothetical protein